MSSDDDRQGQEGAGAEAQSLGSITLTDPRALRAVAHPLRLSLLALLRVEGPLSATQAARRLGESPQLCTFHLGQLARYGLVEEAGGGHGRERPWRATALSTSWPDVAPTAEMAAAAQVFESVLAGRYYELMMRWVAAKASQPEEWREAAQFGDGLVWLTPAELADLAGRIGDLLEAYDGRTADPATRPGEARLVTFLRVAVPLAEPLAAHSDQASPASPPEHDVRA